MIVYRPHQPKELHKYKLVYYEVGELGYIPVEILNIKGEMVEIHALTNNTTYWVHFSKLFTTYPR